MFYKVLKEDLNHHSFQYKEGLNVDTVPFNPKGDCEAGGLYYTNKENVFTWALNLNYVKVADVTIPEDAKVYQGVDQTKWKADRLILSNIRYLEQFVEEELSESEVFEAIKRNGNVLRYVKNQTEEMCLEAVKQSGTALYYVKKQTEKICLEAVKNHGDTLEFVKTQTEQICLEAVKQDGRALMHVWYPTEQIVLEAVKT